jgi:hypothetical protein
MSPIVDGLAARYGGQVAVVKLNALDGGTGQQAFEASGLPGHPGYVLLRPDGSELWRGFGQQSPEALDSVLQEGLSAFSSAGGA